MPSLRIAVTLRHTKFVESKWNANENDKKEVDRPEDRPATGCKTTKPAMEAGFISNLIKILRTGQFFIQIISY